jgi:hypothetical protein
LRSSLRVDFENQSRLSEHTIFKPWPFSRAEFFRGSRFRSHDGGHLHGQRPVAAGALSVLLSVSGGGDRAGRWRPPVRNFSTADQREGCTGVRATSP